MTNQENILLPIYCEWQRVERLAFNVISQRAGEKISSDELTQTEQLQKQTNDLRLNWKKSQWSRLELDGISPLAWDIISCLLAPEFVPKIAILYRQLQGNNQLYPSAALLQELLAFSTDEVGELLDELNYDGFLHMNKLIQRDEFSPLAPIIAKKTVIAQLSGRQHNLMIPGASLVTQKVSWHELVLDDERKTMLCEYVDWVKYRDVVVNQWQGLDIGGPLALFSGASGTGKTFAASVIASELGWALYRVDLGMLVSKYIGETEKNLNVLFDAVHGKKIVLQIDEADSLFGKRGEVRDARDRYANMEVSHLLSRIESHRGPIILTTNLREHIDSAFTRRFQMIVTFQRPDKKQRLVMWDTLLPKKAPRSSDLDIKAIANDINMTGGSIRNAALHAAYLAAAKGGEIGSHEMAKAIWRELNKEGRKRSRSDLGHLAEYLS